MKLLRREPGMVVFSLGKRQKRQLLEVLSLYPRVPSTEYKISRNGLPDMAEGQRLLDEALAEQRTENKRLLRDFLADPGRFPAAAPWTMRLPDTSLEWLLQILNEVRVGSWVAIGSPEGGVLSVLSAKTAPDIWAMEIAGYFQACLLEAITGENLTEGIF